MKKLSPDQSDVMLSDLKKYIPEMWVHKIRIISQDNYINDFRTIALKHGDDDFDSLSDWYFQTAGEIADDILANSEAYALKEYNGPKRFAGLEKSSLEISYRNYLRRGIYSELIEYSTLLGFIGHEYEVFLLEMNKRKPRAGLLMRLLSPESAKKIDNIPNQIVLLERTYETALSVEPSVALLKSQIDEAARNGCYVNPIVHTILERAEENNVKRFRKES